MQHPATQRPHGPIYQAVAPRIPSEPLRAYYQQRFAGKPVRAFLHYWLHYIPALLVTILLLLVLLYGIFASLVIPAGHGGCYGPCIRIIHPHGK